MPWSEILVLSLLVAAGVAGVAWMSRHLAEVVEWMGEAGDGIHLTADDERMVTEELRSR